MANLTVAIGEGEITPNEGEVISNILAKYEGVLKARDRERQIEEFPFKP
jgi:hypothetical protein